MALSSLIWTVLSPVTLTMASKDPKVSKQGTAGKRKHVNLMIPQNLKIITVLKLVKAAVWLWLHTALDHQLSVI
jgi:hypothetical protein